jgi:P-type Mg2+ transporter
MIQEPHAATPVPAQFWQLPSDALFYKLGSNPDGLSQTDADRRLAVYGSNRTEASRSQSILRKLGHRILNPLVAMLLVAAAVSGVSGDLGSFAIIVAVLSLSLTLDIVQEHRAEQTAEALRDSVAIRADVMRDGKEISVPSQLWSPATS